MTENNQAKDYLLKLYAKTIAEKNLDPDKNDVMEILKKIKNPQKREQYIKIFEQKSNTN